MISIDDFSKVEMRIGRIVSAERVPDTDKLLKLAVDFGPISSASKANGSSDHPSELGGVGDERDIRQVISGIAGYFEDPAELVHKQCPFVTNLEPRIIRGLESHAMIVAVHTPEGSFSLLEPTGAPIPPGTRLN